MLGEKLDTHGSAVWLVNTGWTRGPYGEGSRMPINATRTMLDAALSGALDHAGYRTDHIFGFEVPLAVPGVESTLLNPRATWANPDNYDTKARELAEMFRDNFIQRFANVDERMRDAGPISRPAYTDTKRPR
jgi:phosphoenolpyruvate carboxykinase (ATP)